MFRLICSILTHVLKVDEKIDYLLETTKISISKLPHKIVIIIYWSKLFENGHDNILWIHKLVINISTDFNKV
jgi:hypothetical protein